MRKSVSIFALVLMVSLNLSAQHLLVDQSKKMLSGLTMTVETYDKAFNKLKPALTNDDTRNRAETWALANRIKVEQYDKYMDNRRVGKKIDI